MRNVRIPGARNVKSDRRLRQPAQLKADAVSFRRGVQYPANDCGSGLTVVHRNPCVNHFPARLSQANSKHVDRQQRGGQTQKTLGAPLIEFGKHRLEEVDTRALLRDESVQSAISYRTKVGKRVQMADNGVGFVPTIESFAGEFGTISTGFEAPFADRTAGYRTPSPFRTRWCGRRAATTPVTGRHVVQRTKATIDATRGDTGIPLAVQSPSVMPTAAINLPVSHR